MKQEFNFYPNKDATEFNVGCAPLGIVARVHSLDISEYGVISIYKNIDPVKLRKDWEKWYTKFKEQMRALKP